jgi:hypothetical protein
LSHYTAPRISRAPIWPAKRFRRASFRTPAAFIATCTAASCGPCGNSPASPLETNRRYHYLLAQGQTGLSVAFDLPTPMGYDADHALSEGEVGKCGAAISSSAPLHLARGVVTLRRRKAGRGMDFVRANFCNATKARWHG